MTHEQQIKAVAEAILRKVWNISGCPTLVFANLPPGISRQHMQPSYKDAEEIAKLAITAMGEVNAHIPHSSAPCVKDDNLASPACAEAYKKRFEGAEAPFQYAFIGSFSVYEAGWLDAKAHEARRNQDSGG